MGKILFPLIFAAYILLGLFFFAIGGPFVAMMYYIIGGIAVFGVYAGLQGD